MRRFSFGAFAAVAFLHLVGTAWLMSSAVFHMVAYGRGETFPWLTTLSWIWMPVPVFLSHHLHTAPMHYFYYLALPWSLVVGLCCGFIVPYVSRRRYRSV